LNDKTFLDNYRTPHTTKLHVVERWKMVEEGKTLASTITVQDLTRSMTLVGVAAIAGAGKDGRGDLRENNQHLFDYQIPSPASLISERVACSDVIRMMNRLVARDRLGSATRRRLFSLKVPRLKAYVLSPVIVVLRSRNARCEFYPVLTRN